MSRLAKQPLQIPENVTVTCEKGVLLVKGPKGEVKKDIPPVVSFEVKDGSATVVKNGKAKNINALSGTFVSHLRNMIIGVTEGYKKVLEIEGVGYRIEVVGNKVKLLVGFSHPVLLPIPSGITVLVEKNVTTVSGIDKDMVGQFASDIRAVRKPEPYKGKGIHYVGEYIIRKQGKRGVA